MTSTPGAQVIQISPTAPAAGMPVDVIAPPAPADIARVAGRLRALMIAADTYTAAADPMLEFAADRLLRWRAGRAAMAEAGAVDDALRLDLEQHYQFGLRTAALLDLAPDDSTDTDLARLVEDS